MKKLIVLNLILCLGLLFLGCASVTTEMTSTSQTTINFTTTPVETTNVSTTLARHLFFFDFELMNDIVFPAHTLSDIVIVSGYNISVADYTMDAEAITITISKDYLSYLEPGEYEFTLHRLDDTEPIYIVVLDRNQANRIINQSFETGDLFGWHAYTVFKGERQLLSFVNEAIYNGVRGYSYWITPDTSSEVWSENLGILQSSVFTLSGSGFITFYLGRGFNPNLTYLSVRNADNDMEIARFGQNSDRTEIEDAAQMTLYKADLSEYIGEDLYLEFCDYGSYEGNYLTIDEIETYYETEPVDGILAEDIKPVFNQPYFTNQVANGDFSQGLQNWTMVGENQGFIVDAGVLKSNEAGDASMGMIRSTLFRVMGSGIISIELGAAQGARFDKDTFVSIKELGTNRELIRFANRNHDGIFMVPYFVDLSDYINTVCYFEIVDNATGSYDTIFVDNIITYYEEAPVFDFSQMAVNLNE